MRLRRNICMLVLVMCSVRLYGVLPRYTPQEVQQVPIAETQATESTVPETTVAIPIAPQEIVHITTDTLQTSEPRIQQAASRGGSRSLPVLGKSSAKTYMDYKSITSKNSAQWKLIYESGLITIQDNGYLVDQEGRYGVALGNYFGKIGTKVDFTLDTGTIIKCIKVEAKADIHTDSNKYMHRTDGSVIEFVVDTDKMAEHRANNGYIYSGNFNCVPEFAGSIIGIEIID